MPSSPAVSAALAWAIASAVVKALQAPITVSPVWRYLAPAMNNSARSALVRLSHSPLVTVMFNHLNVPQPTAPAAGLAADGLVGALAHRSSRWQRLGRSR